MISAPVMNIYCNSLQQENKTECGKYNFINVEEKVSFVQTNKQKDQIQVIAKNKDKHVMRHCRLGTRHRTWNYEIFCSFSTFQQNIDIC